MYKALLTIAVAVGLLWTGLAGAADSPQFRGPNRDGHFAETGLLKAWPEGGPAIAWTAEGLGGGYSSASVVGDLIYVTGKQADGQGVLTVLNRDGSVARRVPYGKETDEEEAPGTRSTPTIDGNRIYIVSGLGVINCFDMATWEKIWEANILERFNGELVTWHISESVVIDGNKLICTPGGPDASLAALDKMTGETIWTTKGLSAPSAYCSPNVYDHNGRRIIITMVAKLVVGIDVETGEVLWTHEHEEEYDIHAVTPLYSDGGVYYTAGHKSGGGMLTLSEDGSSYEVKWTDKRLDCYHHGVVLVDGYIYGTTNRNRREIVCLNWETGEVAWGSNEVEVGVVIYADGMLYLYEGPKKGGLRLIKATPEGYDSTGYVAIDSGGDKHKHWAHPTIAHKRIYVRYGPKLIAYDIAAN